MWHVVVGEDMGFDVTYEVSGERHHSRGHNLVHHQTICPFLKRKRIGRYRVFHENGSLGYLCTVGRIVHIKKVCIGEEPFL